MDESINVTEKERCNVLKKACWDEEDAKRKGGNLPCNKRLKKTVLPTSTKVTKKQVFPHVAGGVKPKCVIGDRTTEKNATSEQPSKHEVQTTRENFGKHVHDVNNLSKKICRGIFATKDMHDNEVQAGLRFMLKYYVQRNDDDINLEVKQIYGTCLYSMFDVNCKSENTTCRGSPKQNGTFGVRCDLCQAITEFSKNFIRNQRAKIVKKFKIISDALQVRKGSILFESDAGKKAVLSITRTCDSFLSNEGLQLRSDLMKMSQYYKRVNAKDPIAAATFIKNDFGPFYLAHGEDLRKTLVFHLLVNVMRHMQGHVDDKIVDVAMNFFMMLDCISPKASRVASANLVGPAFRNMMLYANKSGPANDKLIIDRTIQGGIEVIVKHHKRWFRKSDKVAFACSIDTSDLVPMVLQNSRHKVIVGGAAPNECIPLPDERDDAGNWGLSLLAKLDSFNGDNPSKKKAAEIKLATATYQFIDDRTAPYLQVIARPQTKNQSSKFNHIAATVFAGAEAVLRDEGYAVSFTSCANDGVSCGDFAFVLSTLKDFLRGKISYSAHTDVNHNVKNAGYQLFIGCGNVTTVGNVLIDTGLLWKVGIEQELWDVKISGSSLNNILRLTSANTVASILNLERMEVESLTALCTSLFFMRVHLFAVHSKGYLTSKQRIILLWSSLLYLLHVDGVDHSTKKNWTVECISMCFLMMRSDVIRPERLTSEPSKQTFARLRGMIGEFTVNDFIFMIHEMERTGGNTFDSNVTRVRSPSARTGGNYVATVTSHSQPSKQNRDVKMTSGPIEIDTEAKKVELLNLLWRAIMPLFNEGSKLVTRLLVDVFAVKELHPMVHKFSKVDTPTEILSRLDDLMKEKDQLSEKKQRPPNSFRDDLLSSLSSSSGNHDPCEERRRTGERENRSDEEVARAVRDRLVFEVVKAEGGSGCLNPSQSTAQVIEEIMEEDSTNDDDGAAFKSFLTVLNAERSSLLGQPHVIWKSMEMMKIGKREKEETSSASSIPKIKALCDGWFGEKIKDGTKKAQQGVIERGSIVRIETSTDEESLMDRIFMVFMVWKAANDDCKKKNWLPLIKGEHPAWPVNSNEQYNFRLGLREVTVVNHEKRGAEYKKLNTIIDGVNVRSTYRVAKLSEVKELVLTVDA